MGARLVPIGATRHVRGVAGASVPTLGAGAHDLREYTVLWAPDRCRKAVCGGRSGTRGTKYEGPLSLRLVVTSKLALLINFAIAMRAASHLSAGVTPSRSCQALGGPGSRPAADRRFSRTRLRGWPPALLCPRRRYCTSSGRARQHGMPTCARAQRPSASAGRAS